MNVLVTGAEGMVGSALCPELRRRGHEVVPTDIAPQRPETLGFDVREREAGERMLKAHRPDLVIHLAAETDVDRCEREPEHAYRTNAAGTEHLADVCRAGRVRLLYMSTAAVFDGEKSTPYVETDIPNPANLYARSKLAGEFAVRQRLGTSQIVRASWMVGGFERDKKFVAKIIRLLEQRRELSVVTDTVGCVTFTEHLSRGVADLIETDETGIFHMANHGVCSRYDIACKIVELLGRSDVTIKPVTSDAFPQTAPRSASEALENLRLQNLGLDHMPSWEEALQTYVPQFVNAKTVKACAPSV